jgi:protein subunit release factor B
MNILRNGIFAKKQISFNFFFYQKFSSKKIENGENYVPRSDIKKMIKDKENIITKQIKASGPGGQHVNKTNSAVYMKDLNTNVSVKVSQSRNSEINNAIAKKTLIDKIDVLLNGSESKIVKKIVKERKKKNRNYRRSVEKHKKE